MPALPDDLLLRLAAHQAPAAGERPSPVRRAAVAALLRHAAAGPEVLLMRRVEQAGDPWSGQVSLPGGGHELEDRDLLATALRETAEEVGLRLSRAQLLCRLAVHPAAARALRAPMDITPFVFRVGDDSRPVPGPEAREVFWLPLRDAASGALDGELRLIDPAPLGSLSGPVQRRMPAWDFGGHQVWGLTYRLLRELLRAGGAGLPE